MPSVWLTSDTHFGHQGVCRFLNSDGTKLRPWDTYQEMDEALVDNWNKVVKPTDKVYHLGDVLINRRAFAILPRLNGDKVLIRGNHDIFKLEEYLRFFRDVRAYHILGKQKIIMSHIPVHPSQLERWRGNIHGHLHGNILDDKHYLNVCVEQTNFTPILMEEAIAKLNQQNL